MRKSLLRSSGIFAANTLLSRVLGFVRDMVIGVIFGVVAGTDAFYVAFKIPNFLRRLFAEGAFSQSFVPVLSEYEATKTPAESRHFLNAMAGALSTVLFMTTVLAMLGAPWLVHVFAPGFVVGGARFVLTAHMLVITFPYIFFISLTAFAAAVLNTQRVFGPPAFTPVILNVCLIVAALWGAPHFHLGIIAVAWGVFFAGILQLLFQIPFLMRVKRLPKPTFRWRDPGVRRVLKLMVPALFGVSVSQINLLIDTLFASFLMVGSVSWLYYSSRLMNFPLGVFGVAISTVILPTLATQRATQDEAAYQNTLDWALRSILLVALPSMLGLLFLAGPLLTTLFHYGAFSLRDVVMASRSLWCFAVGIPAFMLIKVLVSGFYARQDMKTPVKIGVIAMVSNIVLICLLIKPLAHAGLALATSVSAYINAACLFVVLHRRQLFRPASGWCLFVGKVLLACVAMTAVIWLWHMPLSQWAAHHAGWRLSHLLGAVGVAAIVYLGVLWLLGLRIKDLKQA
ncbi:MAG: putative lipid II flippase MurJ [marine bacterium B5-7]|nr:MAG: putative lipid II flippase MurJ [marine bacterium B5-7]